MLFLCYFIYKFTQSSYETRKNRNNHMQTFVAKISGAGYGILNYNQAYRYDKYYI